MRRVLPILVLSAALLGASGCGGGEPSPEAPARPEAAPTPTVTREGDTATVTVSEEAQASALCEQAQTGRVSDLEGVSTLTIRIPGQADGTVCVLPE